MVDAVDLALAEDEAERLVELAGGREVTAKRLLDDEARPAAVVASAGEAGRAEMTRDVCVGRRRSRQVEEAVASGAVGAVLLLEALGERLVASAVIEVRADVVQVARERVPNVVLKRLTRELRDCVLHGAAEFTV